MSKKIGVKVYLDGAPEFNRSLKEMDRNLNELRSEMKLNSEQYKESQNSLEALKTKQEILANQYKTASDKVELYSNSLEKLRECRQTDYENLTKYQQELEKEEKQLSALKITVGESSSQYKAQAERVKELEKNISETGTSIERLNTKEIQLQTSLNNTTAEQLRYEHELKETNAYLLEAEQNTNGLATSINEYGKKTSEADKATREMADHLEALAKNQALEKIGEGAERVLGTLKECAEVAESFEYAMGKVQSIARTSDEELGNMSTEIRRVGAEMGYSANEIAEATYQAISASVDAAHAIGFVEDATKLARAGFTETVTAVDVLTTAINAYGDEANTTAHIADDLITTQNLGKTTVDQLAESIGTIIPTAAAYGVSLDQLSTAYSILTRNGVNTAYSTTYLRGMLNELADSGSDVANILYEKTGHSFGELSKMGYSLGDVMKILGDSVDGNSEAFANLWGNIRAGQGALNIFNAGAEEFNGVLNIMENNAGATEEAFSVMADTAVMTNERFEASVENVKIAIGESLSPAIKRFKDIAIETIEPVTAFIEENPALVAAIAGVVAGVTTLTASLTVLSLTMTVIKTAMGDWSGLIALLIGASAAGGGLLGLAYAVDETSNAAANLNEKLQKNYASTMDAAEASKTSIERAKALTARYEELASKTKLSDDELKELNGIITELNSTIPGCSLAYREMTDGVNDNTEAVKANIEALIAEQEAAANQDTLIELYKEREEAANAVARAEEELAEAEQMQNQYLEQMNSGIGEASYSYSYWQSVVADAKGTLEEANEQYKNIETSIDELTVKTVEYTEAQAAEIESTRAAEEAEKAKEEAIKNATSAIEGQIGLLDEWNDKTKATFDEMQAIWEGQNEGLSSYKEDLLKAKDILASDMDPAIKDLTSSMVEMNDAATLHEFIEGIEKAKESGEGLEELTKLWQEHLEVAGETEAIYAEILLAQEGYADDSLSSLVTHFEEKNTAQEEQNELELTTAEEQKDALTTIATDTVQSMSDAINLSTEMVLKPSIEKMCTTIDETAHLKLEIGEDGKSKVGERLGTKFIAGICKGIEDGQSPLGSAIESTFKRAINSVDMSGIVEQFNAKLGAMLGG